MLGRDRLDPAAACRLRPRSHRNPRRHAVQPGPDRIARAQGARAADQHQERGLKRIIDVGFRCEHPAASAQDHRPVPRDERLEGELITLLQVSRQELPFRETRDGLAPKDPLHVWRCKSVMVHGEALALNVFLNEMSIHPPIDTDYSPISRIVEGPGRRNTTSRWSRAACLPKKPKGIAPMAKSSRSAGAVKSNGKKTQAVAAKPAVEAPKPETKEPVSELSRGDRVKLYASSRHLTSDIKEKCGLKINLSTYYKDPAVGKDNPDLDLYKILVDWEPNLSNGPTSARFAVVDYNRDTEQVTDGALWSEKQRTFVVRPKDVDPPPVDTPQFRQVSVWATLQRALEYFEEGQGLGPPHSMGVRRKPPDRHPPRRFRRKRLLRPREQVASVLLLWIEGRHRLHVPLHRHHHTRVRPCRS